MRRVVLVCGPPGAGKTTYARSLGLDVYDLDDPQWGNDDAMFTQGLARLATNPDAQAVVIRSGATRSARSAARELIDATEIRIIATPPAEAIRRVKQRRRPHPPMRQQIAAVHDWYDRFEPEPLDLEPVTSRPW